MGERLINQVRPVFEGVREMIPAIYGALDWEQKATLLKAIIEAGDHPPGFSVAFKIDDLSTEERDYLRAIGIGPTPDGERPNAR